METKRLNKFITDSGYCSRREADRYIAEGRVTVNGRDARIGDSVCEGDVVEVDGERVGRTAKRPVYIAFNKPVGVTSTSDPTDETNIIDFIGYKERIFHVGRLDKDSEGLIILTNDGDIVNKILRAGNNNPKEYVVTVDRAMTDEFLRKMATGVQILGVTTKPAKVFRKNDTTFVIHLTQGLNRQIRRMCEALGYKVVRLKRVKVMNIPLGNLEPGRWRYFTPEEVREMHELLRFSSGTEEASYDEDPQPFSGFGKGAVRGGNPKSGMSKSSRPSGAGKSSRGGASANAGKSSRGDSSAGTGKAFGKESSSGATKPFRKESSVGAGKSSRGGALASAGKASRKETGAKSAEPGKRKPSAKGKTAPGQRKGSYADYRNRASRKKE